MSEVTGSDRAIHMIEGYINKYKKIIVFDDRQSDIAKLKDDLFYSTIIENVHKNNLFIGTKNVSDLRNVTYVDISDDEMGELLSIYRLYEYTDKIRLVSSDNQYGTMINYLSVGIMTKEEYFNALLE